MLSYILPLLVSFLPMFHYVLFYVLAGYLLLWAFRVMWQFVSR